MSHAHPHPHPHPEAENPFAGQGSVLLDIGGDVGALVVSMPAATVGHEVEIWPRGGVGVGHAPHVAVVDRPTAAGTRPTLVYGALVEGDYDLCDKGSDVVRLSTSVRGGAVTEEDWPAG